MPPLWRTAVWALLLTGHKGANCANQSNCSTVEFCSVMADTFDAQLRSISILFEHWVLCNYAVSGSNKNFPWVETMHARICWSPKATWALCVSLIIVEDTVCSMELKLMVTESSKIAGNCWTTTQPCAGVWPHAGVWSCRCPVSSWTYNSRKSQIRKFMRIFESHCSNILNSFPSHTDWGQSGRIFIPDMIIGRGGVG